MANPPKLSALNSDDAQMTVDIFSATVALTTACIYFFATIRLGNFLLPVLSTLSLSFFILLLPQGYNFLARLFHWKKESQSSWLTSNPSLSLLALIILTLSGLLVPFFNLNILLLFSTTGIALTLICFYVFSRSSKPLITIRFLIISVLLGGWFATTVLSSNTVVLPGVTIDEGTSVAAMWRNPFLAEWLMIGTLPFTEVTKDQLFHASIVNMIKTYGVPSTGLDGVPYLAYHFGSHWIFAQLSNLLNLNGLQFYQLGFPVIVIPFLLKNILFFSLEIRQYATVRLNSYYLRSDLLYWLIFFVPYITVIPYQISQDMIPWWHKLPQSLNSESYTLSIALSFILFSLTLVFFKENFQNLSNIKKVDLIFIIAIFPLLVGLIAIVKVSTGLLFVAVTLYLFIRLQLYKYRTFNVALGTMFLLFAFVYSVISEHYSTSTNIKILGYVNDSVGKPWQPSFFLFHLFWSWIFIVLKLNERKIKTLADLKEAYLNQKILDVEFVFILAFVGILPGTLLDIPFGSAFYFSDFQTWVALSFILANLPNFILIFRSPFNEK